MSLLDKPIRVVLRHAGCAYQTRRSSWCGGCRVVP
jgi:hypothetical protein